MRWALCALPLLLLLGCTARHYRKAADKEVYKIVQEVEQGLFGSTNQFSIDTPYSARNPEEIPPGELIDQRRQKQRRLITIDEALDLAVANSRPYQTEKERLYLTALTLTGERYEFSPQFLASSLVSGDRQGNGERLGQVNSRVTVNQALKTGANISASLANDLLRYYTGDPRRSAVSTISLNLAQPLLRGAGWKINTENLKQAERNVIYALRSYSHFQNTFAVDVVIDYFVLLQLQDNVRNRYKDYLSRADATQRLRARSVDREAVVDVDQAEQAELSAKNSYINSVASYQNALDRFKILLGLPVTEEIQLDNGALEALNQAGLIPVPLSSDQCYQIAVERQLEILNEIDRFEDSKRKIAVSADRLKPDLNLLADASLQSEGRTDYTNFDPDDIRAGVGLQLNLPLDRLRERNAYRATLISFESAIRTLSLSLDNLRDRIDRGLRSLEQFRQNYEIQRNAVPLAERRVLSADLSLQAGRVVVRDLVEAQDALIAAQNALTAARVDYLAARLQLLLDIGILETEQGLFWMSQDSVSIPLEWPAEVPAERSEPKEIIPPEKIFDLSL